MFGKQWNDFWSAVTILAEPVHMLNKNKKKTKKYM